MSDEREMKSNKASNDEVKPDDVEAHVRATKNAATDAPDEVRSGSGASDDGESDDDVTAHVRSNKA
jgi:hypothetical protein